MFDEISEALFHLQEMQNQKFEFDNEVVFQYNYKNDDSAVKERQTQTAVKILS